MQRSFTDRVFGGVCGGLGAALRINAWAVRILFAALTLLTLGGFGVVYILLWWIVPQQSFVERRGKFPALFALLLILLIGAAWVVTTFSLVALPGVNAFWLGAAVVLSAVFFLRQLRG